MDPNDIASVRLIGEYLFSEDPDAVVRAHPEMFADDEVLLADLRNARELLTGTASAIVDSQRTFEAIMDNLALPAVLGSSERLTSTQHAVIPVAVENPAVCMRASFEAILAPLWRRCSADRSLEAFSEPAQLRCNVKAEQKWYLDDAVMVEVLSFLAAEELLSVGENVCASWRTLLCSGPRTQPFWIGVVHREYPNALQLLLEGDGGAALWDEDWRTLAMTLVCAEDDEDANEDCGGTDKTMQ